MTDVIEGEVEGTNGNIVVPQQVLDVIQSAPSGIDILTVCIDTAVWLAHKNISYGDSALNPLRVFSKADTVEQIKVRIDDKLNRLMNGQEYIGDDDAKDLLGYLVLYFVALGRESDVHGTDAE